MTRLPDETRIGRVALDVADLDRAATVYEDAVGLETLERDGERAVLGAGGTALLELGAAPDADPRPRDAAGLFHVAYRVPDRRALADALERIRRSGRMTGASDHLVSEALYLDDPEGNGIEVYRDRPRDEWDRPAEGEVRMDTLPLDLDDLAAESPESTAPTGGSAGASGAGSAPPGTAVGHVHLEVTDLDRARAFYVDALGFDVTARYQGALFVAAGGYHHHVGLNTWNGRSASAADRGLDRFEVALPDEASRAAAVDRLEAAGHPVTTAGRSATVEDPDGIEIELAVRS